MLTLKEQQVLEQHLYPGPARGPEQELEPAPARGPERAQLTALEPEQELQPGPQKRYQS